ncbi:TraP-like type IV secretion system protein (IcmG) [Candidatus Glomeribacter gigasporarum BEG34]|uniref:TraP-like type IV secretion system protein (IcmG) n=1 Tax=Candidatus Glomeribacter gigasporarum BEG34 TaxID=1070319 RepID=G2J859_9BURK|nr:hypothetical protein [Candidatus Glomeribacter gigasporarum]CCD28956.1 TraP-like type IV secretion system protein (IcmG) [Candidatus Glomeribacter gigasporarum BEG34]
MTSDHFASHLDETPASTAHADRLTDERPPESPTSDAVDETSQHAAAQQKRRLPKWLWVTGTIAIFVVGGVGYKKWSGTRHAHPSLAESMPAARFDPANARSAVSGSQGGMMTSTLSQEAQPVSNPTHEATETPQQGTQDGTAANRAAVSVNTETAQASAAPAPLVNEEMRASMQAALDAKEREIAQLKKALADARRSAARATHAAKRARRTRAHVKPRQSSEVMLGFHIKQIIPGQGWVEDEETGRQIIVSVGDSISGAAVTKIDAERYEIQTTAGAIQF